MLGFITKRAHQSAIGKLEGLHREEIHTLATARDDLARQVDEQNRRIVSLEADLRAKNNRITVMQKDISDLEQQLTANARFVEVGKRRLAALDRQNERAKAKQEVA